MAEPHFYPGAEAGFASDDLQEPSDPAGRDVAGYQSEDRDPATPAENYDQELRLWRAVARSYGAGQHATLLTTVADARAFCSLPHQYQKPLEFRTPVAMLHCPNCGAEPFQYCVHLNPATPKVYLRPIASPHYGRRYGHP